MSVSDLTKQLTNNLVSLLDGNDWITATEVRIRGCEGIPDVIAVRKKQYLRKEIRAYEIKVSRSDFFTDVSAMKWRKYLSVCHKVYFATPAGLLKKSEIPAAAGLIVFSDKGWSVIKNPRSHQPPNLDVDAILSILFAKERDKIRIRNLKERLMNQNNISVKGLARKIGGEISRRVAGCTPEVESQATYIMNNINKYFGSSTDPVKVIKFAANLIKHYEAFKSFSSFMKATTDSFNVSVMDKAAKDLKRKIKSAEINTLGLDDSEIGSFKDFRHKEKDRDLEDLFNLSFEDLLLEDETGKYD